ncbi:MAG: S49 family peptidase [Hyphomicrobium sp.]|uniref:S49 family peptidase n=1 Tax=Hyphomicrobium sp. TaxID=82 RepID=UPI003D0A8C08
MPSGIQLQAQSPGTAHADLGFWLQSQIVGQPMAMHEAHLDSLVEQIVANRFSLPRNRNTGARHTEKGTAILEVHGLLVNRYPVMGSFWGLNSYEGLAEQFRRLATNNDVKRVVLDLYSPGGVVLGIRGCSEALEDLAEKKPVHAIAHDYAFSAAYWIGCIAEELSIVPGGQVGSIGVRAAHVSYAEMLERDGIQVRAFSRGAAKGDGSVFKVLTDGEAAERQYEIDRDYERFVAHVAKHRPEMSEQEVRETDARCFADDDAVSAGLADRVETLEEMVERIEKSAAGVKSKRKARTEPGSKAGLAPASRNPPPGREIPDETPSAGKTKGAKLMSNQAAAEGETNLAAQITAALVGMAGKAPAAPAAAAPAAAAEPAKADVAAEAVTRVFAILDCDEAKGKPKLARELAGNAKISADEAKKLLAAAAPEAAAADDKTQLAAGLANEMAKRGNAAGIKPDAGADATQRPSLASKIEAKYKRGA